MEEKKITLDDIEKMLWHVTGFHGDAVEMDRIRVAIEAYALQMSPLWKKAPTELIETHLAVLNSLASELADASGGLGSMGQKIEQLLQGLSQHQVLHEREDHQLAAAILRWNERLDALDSSDTVTAGLQAIEDRLNVRLDALTSTVLALKSPPPKPYGAVVTDEVIRARDERQQALRALIAEQAAAAEEAVVVLPAETREHVKRVLEPKPGCYVNPDGVTITCKTCGKPKRFSDDPAMSEFYKDKQAATGFKSSCKKCEQASKRAA